MMGLTGLAAVARVTPEQTRTWLVEQLYLQRRTEKWEPWAMRETADHDWRAILEAGKAIGKFSSTDWLGEVRAAGIEVPVTLHLDHCPEREVISECLARGWNSVLFDASRMPVEENMRQTVEVVAEAKAHEEEALLHAQEVEKLGHL